MEAQWSAKDKSGASCGKYSSGLIAWKSTAVANELEMKNLALHDLVETISQNLSSR